RLPAVPQTGLPARPVRDPDVTGPAAADGVVQGPERLLPRRGPGPHVDLPQVDLVDTEPVQRAVELTEQPAARRVGTPFAAPGAEAGLGRDHQLVARHDLVDEGAEDAFGVAVAVSRGGVHQRAAGVDERGEGALGFVLVGVLPPQTPAEPETGNRQSAAA